MAYELIYDENNNPVYVDTGDNNVAPVVDSGYYLDIPPSDAESGGSGSGTTTVGGDISGGNMGLSPEIPAWLTSLNKALGGTKLTTSDIAKMAVGAGGLAGALGATNRTVAPTGYQGGIPSLVANRTMMTAPPATVGGIARRPGSAGINYGGDVTYTPKVQAATGGLMGMAHGGAAGRYLQGDTDGMADKISTSIDGTQDAALSHGEFVVPADVVSHLGNGNSDAGAKKLYQMMDRIREARTGTKKQGKEINPDKFTPGGLAYAAGGSVKNFVEGGTTGSAVAAGVTGTEQNLSNWAGPYVTNMLAQGQALANAPYQAYTGPLTAGPSDLQNQAFQTAGNLQTPAAVGQAAQTAGQIGQQAQGLTYTPTTTTFGTEQAQQYMNPYLQASLDPQLAEARRQSQITQTQNAAKMTQAGAFGGGRQAIMDTETQRNLGTNLANITGQGYNTAYTNAMSQFNADQARKAQEAQFGANYGLQGLQTGLTAAQAQGSLGAQQNQMGLANLAAQETAGATQRGIESEGIAADKAAFEAQRQNPYTNLQFQQSLLNGLPLVAQNYNLSTPSALTTAAQGATTVNSLLTNLGLIDKPATTPPQ